MLINSERCTTGTAACLPSTAMALTMAMARIRRMAPWAILSVIGMLFWGHCMDTNYSANGD